MRTLHAALLVFATSLATGCEEAIGPTPRRIGTIGWIRVTASTSGADLDPNGYLVLLDRALNNSFHVAVNDTVIIGTASGFHTVGLVDVAPNCAINDFGSVSLNVAAGDTAEVHFTGSCAALATLQVKAVTTGTDPDPDGYKVAVVNVSGGIAHVTSNGTAELRVAAGDYRVFLDQITANCEVDDANPQAVTAESGRTIAITFNVSCAPVAQLAYVDSQSGMSEIYLIQSNGTGATRLTNNTALDDEPAWSPGGARIAFVSNRDGNSEIYVMNADGSSQVRLTTHPAEDASPDWSPDGSRIVFVSHRDGNAELYVMNADGTNPVRLTDNSALDIDPAWSPDGTRIAFTSFRDVNPAIYIMNADGSDAVRLHVSVNRQMQPAWSPDSRALAFVREACQGLCNRDIVIVSIDGSGLRQLSSGDHPTWSSDGRQVAYNSWICDYDYYGYTYECHAEGLGITNVGGSNRSVPLLSSPYARNPTWRR